MIRAKYLDLIKKIASCNGTGKAELNRRVELGEVHADDAGLIYAYACIEKINEKLDEMDYKVRTELL